MKRMLLAFVLNRVQPHLIILLLFSAVAAGCATDDGLHAEEAKSIAREAYIFTYPMMQNYKTLHRQLVVERKQVNQFYHRHELLDPRFTTVVAPNNDTLYSSAWLDLRNGPVEINVPEIPQSRYYSVQLVDMYVHNMGYIGQRATGHTGGRFLVVGPDSQENFENSYEKVFKSESQLVFTLIRILAQDKEDQKLAANLQRQFAIQPLKTTTLVEKTLSADSLPEFKEQEITQIKSIKLINYLIDMVKIHQSEKELFEKFENIGIGQNALNSVNDFSDEIQQAIAEGFEQGHKEIQNKTFELGRNINGWRSTRSAFGPREVMQGNYLLRAAAAMLGLYGNDDEENLSLVAQHDANQAQLDGSNNRYRIHFEKGEFPPVNAFWSLTIYTQPDKFLYVNEINRYSIGDRTPDLQYSSDGSLTLYLQHQKPTDEIELANWLPVPFGPFGVGLRNYLPASALLNGEWEPEPVQVLPIQD